MVGRPRTVSDDEILDAALVVVGRVGPHGLTLAAVGAEAGLRAPTLMQRFGSKRGLLLAMSARNAERIPEQFAAARQGRRRATASLVAGLGSLVAGIDSSAVMGHHLAFLAMDLADPDLRRLAAAHSVAVVGEIGAGLARAVADGELTRRPEGLARAVYTAYNGALISWALAGRGKLGDWIATDIGAVLAPYRKGAQDHA